MWERDNSDLGKVLKEWEAATETTSVNVTAHSSNCCWHLVSFDSTLKQSLDIENIETSSLLQQVFQFLFFAFVVYMIFYEDFTCDRVTNRVQELMIDINDTTNFETFKDIAKLSILVKNFDWLTWHLNEIFFVTRNWSDEELVDQFLVLLWIKNVSYRSCPWSVSDQT